MFWLKLATNNSPNNWKPSPHFQLQLTVWSGNSTQYLCVSTHFFGGKFFAVYIQVTHCKENKAEAVQLLSSAKLTLKQLITKAKVSELEFHMTKKSFLSSNEQPSCALVMDRKIKDNVFKIIEPLPIDTSPTLLNYGQFSAWPFFHLPVISIFTKLQLFRCYFTGETTTAVVDSVDC